MAQNPNDATTGTPSAAEQLQAAVAAERQQWLDQLVQGIANEAQAQREILEAVQTLRIKKLATWQDIGDAIGISQQAAFQRYGKRLP